jgi:hypothetical protein
MKRPLAPVYGIALALMLLVFGALAPLHAATAPTVTAVEAPKRILFFGNSFIYYNNSLHGHLRKLARAADQENAKKYFLKASTISGGRLMDHRFGIAGMLKNWQWDVVILQGHSNEPIDPKRSKEFDQAARFYADLIREAGAKPAFFMTWAYTDKPEMTEPLGDAYTRIGNETGAIVLPAGLAFARALEKRPDLVLRIGDKKHPTLMGTYLTACVFYAALYDKSPVGVAYTAGLDEADAKFLQEIAEETVKDFYGR